MDKRQAQHHPGMYIDHQEHLVAEESPASETEQHQSNQPYYNQQVENIVGSCGGQQTSTFGKHSRGNGSLQSNGGLSHLKICSNDLRNEDTLGHNQQRVFEDPNKENFFTKNISAGNLNQKAPVQVIKKIKLK